MIPGKNKWGFDRDDDRDRDQESDREYMEHRHHNHENDDRDRPVQVAIGTKEWLGMLTIFLTLIGTAVTFVVKTAIYQERIDNYIMNNRERIIEIEERLDRTEQILIDIHRRIQQDDIRNH